MTETRRRLPLIASALFLGVTLAPAQKTTSPPSSVYTIEVTPEVKHDVSIPLRNMTPKPFSRTRDEKPLGLLPPHNLHPRQEDPVWQKYQTLPLAPATMLNFAGIGSGVYGYSVTGEPPDTNGAVGSTQYVQWVNTAFAVFSKTTGALLYGPVGGNTLWTGFGGPCETNNDGDPIANYDKAANRWVLTQFSVTNGPPFYQCYAVSQTSDATGSWNRYAFSQPNFNDYPKTSVWPDAYYTTYNMFNSTSNALVGGRVCAMDRAAMLTGAAATQQCVQLSSSYAGLLPADLDGSTAPPAGAPNFIMAYNTNSLDMWKYHVDFATPANSTFTGPTNIPVAAFTPACNSTGTCIPQSGTTQQLDSLADRVMWRLAYRNFGDHEAMVLNHTVVAGSSTGVRWYEIRNPNSSPSIYQQGTFAPDSGYRWMGSLAMDHTGNIALGYGVSSGSTFPSIRYTAHATTDPLGQMETETSMVAGGGYQMGNRWGDYSSFNVDPVDDCTLWYTHEYYSATGNFAWNTRIGNIKFSTCTAGGSPSLSVASSPSSLTVVQGTSGTTTITTTASGGFNSAVALSASGLPTGGTASFNPSSIGAPGSGTSTLTLAAAASTPTGTSNVTVTGTGGGLASTTTIALTVTAASNPNFTLSGPGSLTVNDGSSTSGTVSTAVSGGFNAAVSLSVSGLPAGVTGSFNPVSIAAPGSGSSTLTVTATSSATPGTYTGTVTATGNGTTHTSNFSLTVNSVASPSFTLSGPTSVSVAAGTSTSGTVSTAVSGGFNSAIALSSSGLPSGVTATFSPSSIAAPGSGSSTVTYSASAGAAAGTFNTTITATGGGITHTAAVSLTVTTSGGTSNVITDGGFESATVSGNSAPGWTATTNLGASHKIIAYHGSYPHTGTNYAILGVSNNDADTLTQTVTIPAGASAASLAFWVNIVTGESGSTPYDYLNVEVHNSSGTLLATPLTLSNANSTSDNNTAGTYFQPAAINLVAYAGQTIQLTFHATTDGSLPTTFRIDDVALNVTSGGGGGTPPTTSITSPANNATVSGTTTISVTASDAVGVTKIELYIDGSLITSNTNSTSLSYAWNTTAAANGSHSLQSKAYDAGGLTGTSSAISVTVNNSGGGGQQLIVNPGFEQGSSNVAPWVTSTGVVSNSSSEPPHAGSWNAWLCGYGSTHTDTIQQNVTIPSNITTATLSFWLHIDTAETTTTNAYDTLAVQIRNSSGTVLSTLATYSNLNANTGYTQVSFNVAQYKGQTIQVYLNGTEDTSLQTSFVVDDFALNVQ